MKIEEFVSMLTSMPTVLLWQQYREYIGHWECGNTVSILQRSTPGAFNANNTQDGIDSSSYKSKIVIIIVKMENGKERWKLHFSLNDQIYVRKMFHIYKFPRIRFFLKVSSEKTHSNNYISVCKEHCDFASHLIQKLSFI